MAQSAQTYKRHRRYIPVFHFFALPIVVANVVVQVVRLARYRTVYKLWEVTLALALVVFIFATRYMAARVQDRVIRLEERLRLTRLLPEDMHGRIDDLTPGQLVGLRFASDEEVPELAKRCLTGELTKGEQVKKEIKTWRPDNLRA